MKELFKIAFTYSGIEGLQKGIYFLIIPILTYYISASEYGNIAILLMVINFLQIFITFSIESTIMRFYVKITNKKMKKIFLGTIFLSSLFFIVIWIIILVFIGPLFTKIFLSNIDFFPLVFLTILVVSFKMINLFYITFLKTIQDLKEFAIFYNIYFLLQTLLILYFIVNFHENKDYLYIKALLISQVIPIFYVIYKVKKYIVFKINLKIIKFTLLYSFSIIPIKIANIINNSIDRYVLYTFINTSITGIYYLGWQISSIMQIVALALNSAYVPKFYRLYEANKNIKNFEQIYKMIDFIILLILIIEIIFLNIYPFIFKYISYSYLEAKNILPIFIIFFAFNMVYFINTNALSISYILNRKKIFGILIGIVVNLIISLYLVTDYGMYGVAIGSIIGQFITILYFIFLVNKYMDFRFSNITYILFILILFIVNYFQYYIGIKICIDIILLGIYIKYKVIK